VANVCSTKRHTAACCVGERCFASESVVTVCMNEAATLWLLVKFIKHDQNYYLKLNLSTSIRGLHQKKLVLSYSGSWHDGKMPCQESDRMQLKRTMSSTGLKRRWSTESQSVLPDESKRPYTSERKDNGPWTVMMAATNWSTHTTAFLTWRLLVMSRTGRTEYQLLPMKASDRGCNVKF